MNKQLDRLQVAKETKVALGPYTIVEVENVNGVMGWGLSRKSHADRQDLNLGYNIALGRAKKSLLRKVTKKKTRERSVFVA